LRSPGELALGVGALATARALGWNAASIERAAAALAEPARIAQPTMAVRTILRMWEEVVIALFLGWWCALRPQWEGRVAARLLSHNTWAQLAGAIACAVREDGVPDPWSA
jgi:hypothetical protein